VVLSGYRAECLDGSTAYRYRDDLEPADWPTLDDLNVRFDASLSDLVQRAQNRIAAAGKLLRR
jgi:hypothetical protein